MFSDSKRIAGGTAALLSLGLVLSGGGARADIIPNVQSITANQGGGYTWAYSAALVNDQTIRFGDYFTIVDFHGYIPGGETQPANWVFSSAGIGKTPTGISITNNPNVPDLTWTYNSRAPIGPGPISLGVFTADSLYGNTRSAYYMSRTTNYAPGKPGNGTKVSSFGFTQTPSPQAVVPEVNSLMLLLPGLAPLGYAVRKRLRRA